MYRAIRTVLLTGAALAFAPPGVQADSLSGSYLAARQAEVQQDYAAAARYYQRANRMQPGNAELMEALTLSRVLSGDFDGAIPVAKAMEDQGLRSQVAQMVTATALGQAGSFAELAERATLDDSGIGPLVDGLLRAWALVGAGDVSDALAAFDALSQEQGLRGFAHYHKALALALMGDFEGSEAIFGDPDSGATQMTRRGAMARAEILSQLGRNEDALASLADAFGPASDPAISALRAALDNGDTVEFSHVNSAADGLAEVFYSIASALASEAQADYTLLYARMAQALRPDHTDALLLSAELLDDLGQYELAIKAFAAVPRENVDYHAAELGRVGALRAMSRFDAAVEALKNLAQTHGELAIVHSTLGDVYRSQDNHDSATAAYDAALERTEPDARGRWFLLYARAITYERRGMWDKAEANFRAALELNPEQPSVLNYLGYSLVEKQIKLDEALDMIERAVAGNPDSGYIVDSLGWVLYRLGRYEEAVMHMERAVELMPVDPVVTDHLGDVYWAVGRYLEAEFQWRRALSFVDEDNNDTEADPERIRRKLVVGLDVVLEEEGADPLKVADDN